MINRFLNFQTKTITSGALILGVSYSISAVLGLLRDRLLAGHFGAGLELDVYFAAFRIPDFVYNILILGGITIAFLPLFAEYFSRNEKEGWEMVNHILNAFLLLLIIASLILFILTPWLVKFIFSGFDQLHQAFIIPLIRIFLLSPIIFGISNIFSGILQYFQRFFIYGLAPILYNLGIIIGILFFSPYFGIFGVGLGVILGALLHMLIQIPAAIVCGFRYKFLLNFRYKALLRIFYLMIPRVFGVAAQQINLIVITALASTITTGAITVFNFSNNFQSLPVGLIGVSFAVAVFPSLVQAAALKQKENFFQNFFSIFRRILLLIIPVSILVFLLRNYIISIIYKTGKFTLGDTHLTSACLGLFALSIFAQSLIPLLARAFFSLQDTKTPTIITIFAVLINIILSFYFISLLQSPNNFSNFLSEFFFLPQTKELAILGLPLAFSFSAIFQFVFLYLALRKKIKTVF